MKPDSTQTLGELFGITDAKSKDIAIEVQQPGPMTPSVDLTYAFQAGQVRKLLWWMNGIAGRNLMITGPTGCGKSSLIEQFCARIGLELYRAPCHGRMEFAELTGQQVLLTDGSTSFIHGPLPTAMRIGGVLLLDEMNFIHPSVVGALNTVLDGGPLLIPETGELIIPHDRFRVIATGNGMDNGDDTPLYRGVQRMNVALLQRFNTMRADYMEPLLEVAMLHRVAPQVPAKVLEALVDVAGDVRKSFAGNAIESTISTRTLVKLAKLIGKRASLLLQEPPFEVIKGALQFTLTDGLRPDTASAIESVLQRKVAGLKLSPADFPVATTSGDVEVPTKASGNSRRGRSRKGTSGPSGPVPTTQMTVMTFLANRNRQGKGEAAFWAGILPSLSGGPSSGYTAYGPLTPSPALWTKGNMTESDVEGKIVEKRFSRGYDHGHVLRIQVDPAYVEAVIRETTDKLNKLITGTIANGDPHACVLSEAAAIANAIASQMGYAVRFFVA